VLELAWKWVGRGRKGFYFVVVRRLMVGRDELPTGCGEDDSTGGFRNEPDRFGGALELNRRATAIILHMYFIFDN
jgi:hypothetical protein